ncbi:MAG: DUF2508 family protein [Oscillospiraceae bacterium]|nr:DUF2508 family protein [Oscillospiraceae bacterium]
MKLLSRKNRDLLSERECDDISRRITELTEQLADVRTNFDFVTDERAIDALIYEENALLCKIESLNREARERGIRIEPFNQR